MRLVRKLKKLNQKTTRRSLPGGYVLYTRPARLTRKSGIALLEVMVAALIVGISLATLVSVWRFSYFMSIRTDDKGIAYTLARQTMEAVKQTGFTNTSEIPIGAPVVHYFNAQEQNLDASPVTARYKVALSVVSDALVSGSSPAAPTSDALRTVTITVTLLQTGETLYQTSAYLARAGV